MCCPASVRRHVRIPPTHSAQCRSRSGSVPPSSACPSRGSNLGDVLTLLDGRNSSIHMNTVDDPPVDRGSDVRMSTVLKYSRTLLPVHYATTGTGGRYRALEAQRTHRVLHVGQHSTGSQGLCPVGCGLRVSME